MPNYQINNLITTNLLWLFWSQICEGEGEEVEGMKVTGCGLTVGWFQAE